MQCALDRGHQNECMSMKSASKLIFEELLYMGYSATFLYNYTPILRNKLAYRNARIPRCNNTIWGENEVHTVNSSNYTISFTTSS